MVIVATISRRRRHGVHYLLRGHDDGHPHDTSIDNPPERCHEMPRSSTATRAADNYHAHQKAAEACDDDIIRKLCRLITSSSLPPVLSSFLIVWPRRCLHVIFFSAVVVRLSSSQYRTLYDRPPSFAPHLVTQQQQQQQQQQQRQQQRRCRALPRVSVSDCLCRLHHKRTEFRSGSWDRGSIHVHILIQDYTVIQHN